MDLRAYHEQHPVRMWLAGIAVVAAIVGIGLLVDREATLGFLWRTYVGPLVADAQQRASVTWNGIEARGDRYPVASYPGYAVVLLAALATIHVHVFRRRGVALDQRFIVAVLPVVIGGPVLRVLEDAHVFCRAGTLPGCDPAPLAYFFISPVIYIVLGVAVAGLTALLADARAWPEATRARQILLLTLIQLGGLVALATLGRAWFGHVTLWAPILVLATLPAYQALSRRGWSHVHAGLLAVTLAWALVALAYVAGWMRDPWLGGTEIHLRALPWMVGFAAAATILSGAAGRALATRFPDAAALANPIGLAVVGGHMLDGFATFFAVCGKGGQVCTGASFADTGLRPYTEQHFLSEVLLGFGDGWGFPVVKLAVSAGIVLAIHRALRLGREDPTTAHLLLLAILAIGAGPGTRDVVRAAMGV